MMDLEDSGGGLGPETVYGTHEDSHVVMSEKVQSLAGSIYQEFERMIARYDEDVVKTLMPLLVNVLECLDAAYQANQEHDVELELLREDNEQLVTQYEREKGGRKAAEQKLLEAEDIGECERKELSARLEALESIVRMLELKHKNSTEHAARLEEREAELKREYAKLHDRYTELFKTHMDYMERTKLLLSGGQLADRAEMGRVPANRLNIGRSSGPVSFGFASLEGAADGVDSIPTSPISSEHSSPSLHSELDGMNMGGHGGGVKMVEKAQETDAVSLEHRGTVTSPSTPGGPATTPSGPTTRAQTKNEKRSANTLYQELSFQDSEALADVDEGADITGSWVHPGEYASSGMGKEVENLIMENNELLATKNALNIVKDDLIVKVDELTGEQEMLREEIGALKSQRERSRARIGELEEELKRIRDAAAAAADTRTQDAQDDEQDVPMAQRKRFTRVEMARVLMERNQYKERFMELQEAVRWTEMIRASKNNPALDKKSKQSIWKFFSNLFGGNERPSQPLLAPHLSYHAHTHHVIPGVRNLTPRPTEYLDTEIGSGSERLVARRAVERREQYRQVRAHVRKEDGRLQAYGWSLPGKVGSAKGSNSSGSVVGGGGAVPVPVPVYCRPLAETQPGMKIWCAAGVNLLGGHTRDGGLMVGGSVFYYDEPISGSGVEQGPTNEVESLDRELHANREAATLETQLSSLVWICTSTHAASAVTVVDANNPAEVLRSFPICANHVLCIASVPGASSADYTDSVTKVFKEPEPTDEATEDPDSQVGRVKYIELEDPTTIEEDITTATTTAAATTTTTTTTITTTTTTQDENQNTTDTTPPVDSTTTTTTTTTTTSPTITTSDPATQTPPTSPAEPAPPAEEPDQQEAAEEPAPEHEDEHWERWERKENMSSVLATMWLGSQSGWLYVHSSVANWATCLHKVKLNDAVLAVVHVGGRVVAALADGSVAVFRRDSDGQWDLHRYHIITLGSPHHSVRCLSVVGSRVWAGYRNRVHVLDPRQLDVVHTLEAHPRRESQVRQLAWLGEGVWVSIRLDSTLRLYHAYTYQHLQDVDIEPYVSKMLGTGKLGFSFVRITALLISSNRLWIGTGNGVIISVPLSEHSSSMSTSLTGAIVPRALLPGTGIRITPSMQGCAPGGFVPYCTMAHAQLSFHGHRDVVKFFVAVPGTGGMSAASTPSSVASESQAVVPLGQVKEKKPPAMLVISGGEGYIDFRIGDGDMEESVIEDQPATADTAELGDASHGTECKGDKGHLIVWQVTLH